MKLVHVVPHVDQEAAGPSYSVPRLCTSLAMRAHDVELSCLAARVPVSGVRLDVHRQWPILKRFAVSPSHARALRAKADHVDIVHNHSLWSMVNVAAGLLVPGHHAKLVTSPRGTLAKWALDRNRLAKRALWPWQRRAVERADLLHATSDAEYEEIRALGLSAPVAVIPNGVDVPLPDAGPGISLRRTLLYLGRMHPKKGLDTLLEAWRGLQDKHGDWDLVIVGCGEPGYESEIMRLSDRLSLRRVAFAGPLYGPAKSRAYFDAGLFVLPTRSENFGMVVAEALAHGCPAVVSRGAPWAALEQRHCGWWVPVEVAGLAEGLDAAMSLPAEELARMGALGRAWMEQEFGWDSIAERFEAAYAWLCDGGTAPPDVRCS